METGEVVQYNNEEFIVVENQIVAPNKKRKLTILLNVWALVGMFVLAALHFIIVMNMTITIEAVDMIYFVFVYIAFFLYVVVHELLHGAAFHIFGKVAVKDIKFGVVWKSAMAYCVSMVPVSVRASRLSLMMPIYVICIPAYVIGLILDIQVLCLGSILFLSGSAGDVFYMWKLRNAKKDQYMMEMLPTKSGYEIGYLLLEKK